MSLLVRYVDALSKSGGTEKALGSVKTLLALAPDDPAAITRAARVNLDAGKAKEAAALYDDLVKRFGDKLAPDEKADVMLRFGEALLKSGDPDAAVGPLNDAADLAPDSPLPLQLLCKVFEAKKDFEEVVRIKNRRLDVVSGEERSAPAPGDRRHPRRRSSATARAPPRATWPPSTSAPTTARSSPS